MAKGDVFRFIYADSADPVTGVRVTRLSPPGTVCLRNYFYQKCFTDSGDRLLFGMERDGLVQLCILELAAGKVIQLTDGSGTNVQGSFLSADEREAFFTRGGRELVSLDLETLEERVVYSVPAGWLGYGTWVPNSGSTRLAAMEMLEADCVVGLEGWDRFIAQFHARPRMRLLDIDLSSGAARTVFEERRYLGHPMFRPGDDSLMGFCREGPHDLVDSRIWFIDRDGSRLRRAKDQAPGEACTHEFWLPDGTALIYVSYARGEDSRSIWKVDPGTLRNERIMDMPPCAHLMSNSDGSLLVGDGAGQLGDVADKAAHAFSPDPNIYLFDMANRSHRPVCGHRSSWSVYKGNTQANHPHPSFTPDGNRVYFASDRDGEPALYLADLPGAF